MKHQLIFIVLITFAIVFISCGGGGSSNTGTPTNNNNQNNYKPLNPDIDQNFNVHRVFLGRVSANNVELFAFVDIESSGKAPYTVNLYTQTANAPAGASIDCDWGDKIEPVKNLALDTSGKATLTHQYNIGGTFNIKLTLNIPNDNPLILTSSDITITSDTALLKVNSIQHVLNKHEQPRQELYNVDFTGGLAPFSYVWTFNSGQYKNQSSTLSNPVFNIDLADGSWDCSVTITDSLKQTVSAKSNGKGPWKPLITNLNTMKIETGSTLTINGFQFGSTAGSIKLTGKSGIPIVPYTTAEWSENTIKFKIDKVIDPGANSLVVEAVHDSSFPIIVDCLAPLSTDIELTEDNLELERDFTLNALNKDGVSPFTHDWVVKYYQETGIAGPKLITDTSKTQKPSFKGLINQPIELTLTVTDSLGVTSSKTLKTPDLLLSPYLAPLTVTTYDALSEITLTGIFFGIDASEVDVILSNAAKGRPEVSIGALKSYSNTSLKFDLPANALSGDLQVVYKKSGKELKSIKRSIVILPTSPIPPNGTQL